jgi:GDP-L-fucose synthase
MSLYIIMEFQKGYMYNLGESFSEEYNFSSANVVVSNMYGPNDHFDEERSHALGAIIKKVYEAKKNNFENEVTFMGNGKTY